MSAIAVPFRSVRSSKALPIVAGVLAIDAIALASLHAAHAETRMLAIVGVGVLLVPCALYLAAFVRPIYLLSAALFLAMFSGHWGSIGLPAKVAPDRYLFVVGLAAFLLRDPDSGERRALRFNLVWVLLGLAAAFAIGSAIAAHSLFKNPGLWVLVDRFGLVPFATFVVAPAVFATERDRRILLATLVAMATYLAFVTTAQGIHLNALVFPRYILNINIGAHQAGRARGPFGDSAVNGFAMFAAAVVCALAVKTWWATRWRWPLAALGVLCLFDIIFTLDRAAFLGSVIAIVVTMLAVSKLRRYLPIVLVLGVSAVGGALLVSSGLRHSVSHRIAQQNSVWDRLNTDKAAERMFLARPLVGFGWGSFITKSVPYFELSPNYPFTGIGTPDHNVFLSNLAELGIIGTGLWVFALAFGIGGAILRRGPPELVPWRVGLLAIAVMWLVVANFAPILDSFPNQLLWLWAGVAWGYGLQAAAAGRAGPTPAVAGLPAPAVGGPPWPARRRGAHPAPRQPVAHAGRRRIASARMTLVVLTVGGLATLGFLAGQATAGGPTAHPAHHAAVVRPSPTYARTLDAVMRKLNATRASAAARLRGAHDTKTQIQDAQVLATAHKQAAAAVAALSAGAASTVNAALAHTLGDVSSAYASLGQAASRNDGRAYRSAQAAVIRANESLRTVFGQLRPFGYRLG
jgi:putative inorganic carbon (hco3(-)) transporter